MFKKKFPSLSSLGSDGNTSFLRAARAGHLDKVLEQLKNNVDINTSNANGLNALHLASKDGHIHVVTELLKRGANVDSATKKGNTALHIASLAGQEEVVKLLVEHGASVNVQSQNGFTPLYMAAQENHDNVVRFLLSNGANQSLATEDGFTPLAVAMQQGHDKVVAVLLENDTRGKVRLPALHIAAKKDDCKAAALLLQNEHNPDVTSKSGFTPLHIASHYGNQDIANLLLNKGADVNYSAKHNITPLHVAAKWGKSNMVGLLLEKGANIESKTRDGLTPLHCAARSGHEQVVDMLLERGAPISSKTKNGLAPLHMSSQGDHVDAARILLYHRAPVDEVTVDYLTALHVAAHCGHARVAKLLLDRKADPNARALNGFTPLHIACKKNRIKVVELLLKHGASIEATTESGLTPLHVASFMGCMNIVIYLLQNEANPDVPTVRGETPLHLAARANQTDIIRILLRNGAQVDARAREQQTPLHIAARLGNVDIVMLLLQHGAAVDSTTKDLYTALHIAAKEGQDEVAQVLLENGASPTATTKKGFTPLHLASKYGNMKVASLLLQRDAPVDAQGKNGVTPLHVASHYDHQNVALLLLDKGASPHATAKNGHTPLHIAAKKNQMDIATTLLEYGAKADIESKAGFTPLHLSAQEGHIDMTSLLIDHQADTNHKAKNGLTPLHLCAQEDRVNVATVLLKNGAEVDATTKAGYTPLHVASHFGQLNMVRFLVDEGAKVGATTSVGYTPLHQAAQQGHSTIVNTLLESGAPPNVTTNQGQTALSIAQKLGYISVVESLKGVTEPTTIINTSMDEKYKVVSPETMQETFMSDSEDEGGEDTLLSEQPYRYLTVDEMKSLGDDSLPIDVTRDERADSNRECMTAPPTAVDDTISPQHLKESYSEFGTPDNVDISRHPLHVGFLVSFLVDARGGAMRGCRHSGVRVIVPPRRASQPMRVTCRYLKRDKLSHPPPLMEGEALASRILELGPVGAKFLGPVMIEVPHFGSLRGKEREIVILRSDNGETWREHTVDANEDAVQDILSHSFDKEEISQLEDAGRTTRILTTDFPHYFAVVTRVRQEVHAIGPEGGMVSSSVVPQVQAVFPQGALTKKIKVGLQAQPISAELAAKLLGNRVAVSPIVTVEPRRRKFHKPITLTIPKPQAANKGMINQYSGDAPTLRLLCSITGGTTRAQWEDVTGSTPFTFVNDCVSFTTTVSARFWLMDCRNVVDATKMATELYREAIHVPFMAKFVVFAKRVGELEARLRVFCMTDDKEDKTLEHQEHFTEVAKSRDVEVLEGKSQYVEFAGNLIPVTKSGEQLQLGFRAFRENRLPFTVRVKDPHADTIGRTLFMREPKVPKGEPPQQPICILNIVLPEEIIPETGVLDHDLHKYNYIKDSSGLESYQRADLRLSDISNLLGEDWVRLAGELNISTSDINRLKTEYPNSDAQQGLAMLRLWLQKSGNKAQANTLEAALSRLGRDDIIQQCVFNIDQTGFDLLKEELGPSRDASLKRDIRVENVYTDQDIMKDSESIGELSRLPHRKAGESAERDDKEERKYVAEEKEVEEKKSVLERRKEIEGRLLLDKEKLIEKQVTKVVVEETIITQKQKIAEDLTEKEIAEEKKLSPEEQEPSDLTFEQKRLSFEQGKKLIELKPDKKKTDVRKETDEKITSEDIKVAESEIDETSIPFQEKRLSFEQGLKAAELKREERSVDDQRRDSELFEGVSQGLVSLDTVVTSPPQDLLSPKVSKTPPPSPAEFKDTTVCVSGAVPWQDDRQAIPAKIEPVQDWTTKRKPDSGSDAEKLESSRNIDTQHGLQSGSDSSPPKPPPRIQKSDTQEDTTEKSEEDIQDYSIRKKFWEQMSSSGSTDSDIKSQRSQDSATPPIPRPRSSIVSSAPLLKSEAESDTETTATTLSDSTVRIKNIPQDSVSKQSFTGSSDASDKEEGSEPEAIDLSGPNTTQSVLTTAATVVSEITDERPSKDNQTVTTDSSDSEAEYIAKVGGGTLSYENNGFVADEEELKGVLEKNKINGTAISEPFSKRIVQQKSESAVPVAATRKTVYERSVSLPTENITDVSENSVRARKRFFEQQIKKEMVVDQLMTQLEEESSPEHKSIHNQTVDRTTANTEAMVNRQIHSHIFSHELEEQIESLVPEDKNIIEIKNELIEEVKPVTVKEIASAFGKVDAKKSVKRTDSVSYEAEVIKIQQSDQIMQKGISGKDETQFEHVDQLDKKVDVKQICDVFEQKVQEDLLPQKISLDESLLESVDQKLATKEAESIKELAGEMTRIESIIDIEKKDIILGFSIPEYIHESIEEALQYKSEVICQPSDSLEVHIDKSEIEATEKEAELDDEFKSLEKESKEDYACTEEDLIPSITVTLSGKQRTESYSQGESEDTQSESDITPEEAKNKENVKSIQELDQQEVERISDSQISKGKQPHVYTPEEHIPDTVWEVPVQQEPETNDQEMVQDIPIEKQVIVEKDEDDSQQFSLTEVSAVPEAKKSLQLTQKPYPLTKVEARKIAEEVVENIESEIAKRSDMITDLDETISPAPSAHLAETQVSDYFKHLSDREEIEKKLFESVLAKKQREHINKLTRTDTTTSSMEITDEDLRSSGVETDISPIEVQGSKLYQVEDRSEDDATEDFTKIEKDLDDEFEQVDLEKDFKNIQLKLHEKDHKYNQVEGIDSQKGGETLKYEDSCKSVKSETMKVIELENDLGVEMHFQTDELIEEKLKKLKEKEVVEKTLAEVKESLEAAQEELIEEHKKKKEIIQKKQSPSEFEFKVLTLEKTTDESIQESSFEETGLSLTTTSTINDKPIVGNIESKIVETEVSGATLHAHGLKETSYIRDGDKEMLSDVKQDMFAQKDKSVKDIKVEETISIKHQDLEMKSSKRGSASYSDDEEKMESAKFEEKLLITAEGVLKKTFVEEKEESSDKKGESFDYDSKTEEVDGNKSVIKEEHKKEEHTLEKVEEIKSSIEGTEHVSKDGLFIKEKSVEKYQISTTTKTESREEYHSESNVQICTEIEADEAMVKELLSQGFIQQEGDDIDDICKKTFSVIEKQEIKRTYSEESQKSSQDESVKSPVGTEGGISSSSSSGRRGDSDTLHTSERPEVVMRKHKTVESVAHRRSDRRSGTDYEPYSSSGESHYHSFEQTSESIRTPSRPCSSDMEALVAGIGTTGSSEYESAMSHEVSGRSLTSHDYHTAVSSLSSRESMKSLDSESSGNLASVEISSEASETLVPSAMELEKDMEGAIGPIEEEGITFKTEKHFIEPYDSVIPHHIICGESPPISQSSSTGKQFEQSPSFDISGEEVSGEDNASKPCIEKDTKGQDSMLGMKRSHEMIFQPEPQPIISESPMSESSSHEEKFSSSLDDVGSVLSLSSISDTAAIRTVIELSRTESDKMDGSATSDQLSMTVSATSEQSFSSGSREDVEKVPHVTKSEITTATQSVSQDGEVSSVTLTTSTVKEGGIQSVSTQVTSQTEVDILSGKSDGLVEEGYTCSNGPTQVDYNSEYDDVREIKKRPGHRRSESKSFKPSMIPVLAKKQDSAPKNLDEYVREDAAESDKYTEPAGLTLKEGRNDEKKDVDEAERIEDESYQTEADQGFHRDLREGRRMVEDVSSLEEDHEELQELDSSRPQSQVSKSDSESGHRPMSAGFSDDRPDSELAELLKQCSSDAGSEDPIERPKTPEPIEESEIKDDTPEFSSEAQASVTELEMEYSGAFSRSIEYESHVSPIREKAGLNFEGWEQHFSDHEDELAEAEAAFQMVPHISPAIVSTLPATIPEDPIAEKHELETREMDLKEELRRRAAQMEATSPGSIPDITVTQHMTPLIDRAFHYPDLELEEEIAKAASTPQTPASVSSRASSETETDQGREYILEEEEGDDVIAEELDLAEISVTADERTVFESKDEVLERDSATDSPGSDSFEMLEKPDIADEFVIIEEVGKEAHEQDCEGKSVQIKKKRVIKKVDVDDEEITSPPAPSTRMTEIKYYPSGGAQNDNVGPFPFDSDSPPTNVDGVTSGEVTSLEGTPPSDDEPEFEHEVEAGKKWIEMQFHGDHATAVYGYDIEYEHGPLEDIKEEDANDLEQSSSRFGSLGSQVSHSVGSFGSVNKASLGSTPDYDVLAGRKYFTRSGEHDDVSMSSLQEFERLENLIAMESSKNKSHGSQDSLGSGNSSGNSKRFGTAKSGGDDVSVGSLKEFEGLETACLEAAKIEIKAKEEEALLSEIDEGHESQASESESCETISAGGIKGGDSDSDDYEKRMFEIDEIIRQAQSNVERFIDVKDKPEDGTDSSILDRTESVGRGDSLEEVARVPDLDLDAPLYSLASVSVTSYSGKNYVQQWKEREDEMLTSTDSLDVKTTISKSGALDPLTTSTDSLDPKTLPDKDAMSASTDSIEYHLQEKKSKTKGEIMTDSIEIPCDKTSMLTSTDSLEMDVVKHMTSDSIDEEEDICGHIGSIQDQSSSSGREGDLSSSGKEDSCEQNRMPPPRAELLLGSTDSLEPSSSTATHATYQYETDSMMSSSFTSGGSNTMVSSTETLDASAKAGIWFEDGRPYVTEVIEPVTDDDFSHTIHRTVELPPEIHKVTFRGPDAEQALREYIDNFAPGEDTTETQEVDADGNVHIKRVIQRRVIVRPEEMGGPTTDITGPELEKYLRHLSDQQLGEEPTTDVVDSDFTHLMSSITGTSSPSHSTETHRTYVTRHITSSIPISLEPSQKEITTPDTKDDSSADEAKKTSKSSAEPGARAGGKTQQRPPLKYDISMDEEPEFDPREHDWRFQLPSHSEGEENLFELAAGFRDTPPTDETDSLKKSSPLPKPQ